MKLFFIIIPCVFFSFVSFGSTITVNNTQDSGVGSLRHTIAIALSGDTIRFNPSLIANGSDSIVLNSSIAFSKSLWIKGLYNSTDTLFISGGQVDRIFTISYVKSITLDSLVLQNGQPIGNGGAISIVNSDTIHIINSVLRNNFTLYEGGGLYSHEMVYINIYNSVFKNNYASYGAGIYSETDITTGNPGILIEVNQSSIIDNRTSSNGDGGGICSRAINSKLIIENSEIKNNYARAGGGIFIISTSYDTLYPSAKCVVFIDSSTVSNNHATEHGGGMSIAASGNFLPSFAELKVKNSKVNYNSTGTSGGGISLGSNTGFIVYSKALIDIENSEVLNNTGFHGGGVFIASYKDAQLLITKSKINGNSSTHGGGVYGWSADSMTLIVNQSELNMNSAQIEGGGIRTKGASYNLCKLNESTVDGNSGGGISTRSRKCSFLDVYKSTISNNVSSSSGSAINTDLIGTNTNNTDSLNINIETSTIYGNSTSLGSVVFCYSDSLIHFNITNSTLTSNSCANYRSIYLLSPKTTPLVSLESSILALNTEGNTSNVPLVVNSLGYNLFSDTNVIGILGTDILGVDSIHLNLDSLSYNGGLTKTVLPRPTSIAVNSGNPNDTSNAQNSAIVGIRDIGAAESCAIFATDSIKACGSYTWIDGIVYDSSTNVPLLVIYDSTGCDSVISLNLLVDHVDTSVVVQPFSLEAQANNASFQWVDCNTNSPIFGATSSIFTINQSGDFAVEVTQNGCIDTSACYNFLDVSTKNLEISNNIKVYPNPVIDYLTIEFVNYPKEDVEISFYNLNGTLLESKKIRIQEGENYVRISTKNLSSGIYFVKILGDNSTLEKIVVQ